MSEINQEKFNEIFDEILAPTIMSGVMSGTEKIKMAQGLWQLVKILEIEDKFEEYLNDELKSKSKYTIEGVKLILDYKI